MSEINENEICEFSFEYKASHDKAQKIILAAFLAAYEIEFEPYKNIVTVFNQKIKNHAFIEKLFNLNLYE